MIIIVTKSYKYSLNISCLEENYNYSYRKVDFLKSCKYNYN